MQSLKSSLAMFIMGASINPPFLVLLFTTAASLALSESTSPWIFNRSSGVSPKQDSDGLCYNYTIQATDTCQSVAKTYKITVAEIETYNSDNWGWQGCNNIHQGSFICLSSGAPPMPVALPHATCGPQVPGTARPSDYAILSSLNPCPSNECVSITLDEF